ncbi:UvrD-helicase domain-containing protein [Jannaschia formosa]|uniref:UvrD-helicase domain-containing protein n=1 Tax=Jannaschia formosa TaxID=2259592 RepID=UPI000E1BB416|nr:UvrD-helicase domain-containing protein [Jannaschia formosa]TFL16710.1 DNA helicase [Jannaschia formosa]
MTVALATSFTKALGKLTEDERKQAKITALDVQTDPDMPGLSLHRITHARDPNFWSARVSRDLRLILHKTTGSTLIAYVGHHDDAYAWAERRRIEVHPKTGAMQIVELRERIEDVVVQRFVDAELPPVINGFDAATVLSWGVPEDWVEDVLAATDATVLDVAGHLPEEAAEAVLRAAAGEPPLAEPPAPDAPTGLDHPDARRRFRLIGDQAELAAALDAPWDEWTIFLHPAQREFAERDFSGPARVIGSAGTGKTVVALHRAARLARAGGRVLLSTFSDSLAVDLSAKTDRLAAGTAWRALIDVATVRDVVARLLPPELQLATDAQVAKALSAAAAAAEAAPHLDFLEAEWRLIVDAWNVTDANTYRELPRLGRGVRLPAGKRDAVWPIFERTRTTLLDAGAVTPAAAMHRVAADLGAGKLAPPFDHVIVDEAQDLSPPELTLLAALAKDRPNGLFFAGDIGQRIFRAPFPWSRAGVDVRGRSRALKVNYRTSHEIRIQTETLLPRRLVEADGLEEDRTGITSVFHGPLPALNGFPDPEAEKSACIAWLAARKAEGASPDRAAILVRSEAEVPRGEAVAEGSNHPIPVLLMHDAKGREFQTVILVACDADVVPSEARLLEAEDERAMAEVFETERHLLYVAATRARDHLWISGVEPVSDFLIDLVTEA